MEEGKREELRRFFFMGGENSKKKIEIRGRVRGGRMTVLRGGEKGKG